MRQGRVEWVRMDMRRGRKEARVAAAPDAADAAIAAYADADADAAVGIGVGKPEVRIFENYVRTRVNRRKRTAPD